ncbi:TonB-dependent siderophore receptor [Methylocapsa palsarum]|uniref:Iron complex outermembrane recepter protein n=1 Tax=Methylocapsa palsarum TaxID=1612308 RepID=A0A1I4BN84_9HYPH|nr:TonB-dependent siderophore receptor [Methylocapsa palsarum]SFK69446.1 iron complex outermembrane recepter protein [Methylocapsa palsarum]
MSHSSETRAAVLLAALSMTAPVPAPAQTAGDSSLVLPEVSGSASTAPAGGAAGEGGGAGAGPPLSPSEKAGYSAPPVASSAKIDVPQFDLPISIQTVPEQVITDQNALSLADTIQNVSGVRSNSNNVEGYVYNIRGFTTTNVFRNGLLVGTAIPQSYDTSNLTAVEVLKGPASFLFGRADPGGVINRVTKKPLDTPYYSLTQEFGSFNLWRTVVDMTGPVAIPGIADKSVSYRFSGSYQNGGDFTDFINNQNIFLAPSVSWQIDPATKFTVEAEYNHQNAQSNVGQPAIGSLPPYFPAPIPAYRSFGEPNEPPDTVRSSLISYDFKHNFNSDWAIENRFLAARATITKADLGGDPFGSPDPVLNSFNRNIVYQKLTGTNYSTNLDLTGKFYVLGARNDVLIGADYFYSYYNYILGGNGNYPINIYNPVYGGVPTSAFYDVASLIWQRSADNFTEFASNANKDLGVYAQDSITLFDNLHILLGGRYDLADVRSGVDSTDFSNYPDLIQPTFGQGYANFGKAQNIHNQAFSPRVGVNFQPVPWLSFYGSYTKSFGANNGVSALGVPLAPEIAEGWEGGVKAELLDHRLTGTLAFFNITKSNYFTPNQSSIDPFAGRGIGLVRSTGVELDVLGKLTDEWSIIASYAHIDARVVNDLPSNFCPPGSPDTCVASTSYVGNSLNSYAPDSGSVWLTYAVPPDALLHGWTFGGGVFAAGNRWGDDANTFILPAYARLDAMAKYQFNAGGARWTAQINLKNIANATYYEGNDAFFNNTGAAARFGVFPGAPRAVTASLRVEF